jgi:acylglycerol lipase
MDFSIKLNSGLVLRGIVQSPGEDARAVIVMVHGIGEHIKRYTNLADKFKSEGIGFVGVDLPGHGLSPGRRGHILNYNIVREMIDILISSSRQTFPGIPVYLYGHSLGGGIVLDYILRRNPRINGAIVTSPWIRLSFQPPKSKVVLASILRYILPGVAQSSGLNVNHLSHDPEVIKQYKADPLIHDKCSASLFYFAMITGEYVLENSHDLKIPTLLLHGSGDEITSPEASKEFAARNNKTDLRIFEGGYHELHNEPFREEVYRYILDWIDRRC